MTVNSADRGLTRKWLWQTTGARRSQPAQVETVLMRYPDRATVCVSSQAGCAMGCTFCATGQAGFERHLASDEIVEQVVRAAHESPQRVGNVVFMGMGEPLANLDAVWAAIERLHGAFGLSARHITVSTVGVVPGMRAGREAAARHPRRLAARARRRAAQRARAVEPPVSDLRRARRRARPRARRGRRVTFEYACIAEVNDHPHQARALAGRLHGFPGGAHVNLIPLNATSGYAGAPSGRERIVTFAETLRSTGVTATIRRNRGTEIDAACGQLRSRAGAVPATAVAWEGPSRSGTMDR